MREHKKQIKIVSKILYHTFFLTREINYYVDTNKSFDHLSMHKSS